MKKKIEEHESSEKPLWNKQLVLANIEEAVAEKGKKIYPFWWLRVAVACMLIIFGLLFFNNYNFKSSNRFSNQNSPKEIIKYKIDTIYRTVTDTTFIVQKNTIVDTIWQKENSIVIHDTVTSIKEVWVERQIESSEKKQETIPIVKENSEIKYAFNKPIGEYSPKSQIRFKISNKAVYPVGNPAKETFIALNK